MGIDAAHMVYFVIGLAIFMAVISFYLGRRKIETPILAAVIGFLQRSCPQ